MKQSVFSINLAVMKTRHPKYCPEMVYLEEDKVQTLLTLSKPHYYTIGPPQSH